MAKNSFIKIFGLSIVGFLVAGCGGASPNPTGSNSDESPTTNTSISGSPSAPTGADREVTGIKLKWGTDFYMQVGQVLDFNATIEGKVDESKKGVAWRVSNPYVVNVDVLEDTSKITLTALKEGTVTLTANSTYSPSYEKSVSISVIDESYYTYLFQQNDTGKTADKNQNKFNGEETALASGSAELNGMNWDFTIETPENNKVTGGQMLKFGTSEKPLGALTLSTTNTKKIRKLSLYCSSNARHIDDGSSHGSSEKEGSSILSVKIGETTYINNVATPKYSTEKAVDIVTGGDLGDNPLSGDISISFSAPKKDAGSDVNGGSIYLKAIIIEYYRGPLDSIELDGLTYDDEGTPIRYEKTYQFYKGGYFNHDGVKVYAKYSEDAAKIDVTRFATFTTDNLDKEGKFNVKNITQDVKVSYTYFTSDKSSSTKVENYDINIADSIKNISVTGPLTKTSYTELEKIDYSGITIHVNTETVDDFKTYELADYESVRFQDIFDASKVETTAKKEMEKGFSFTLTHKATGLVFNVSFVANEISVKTYENKTFTKVKSLDEFDTTGYYLISIVDLNDDKILHIWNGALSADEIMATGGVANYNYTHSASISDSFTTKDGNVQNAAFVITKDNDNKLNIILASTKDDVKPLCLSALSTPGFREQNKEDNRQQFEVSIVDDVMLLNANSKTLYYNKSSKRFTVSTSTSNTLAVSIYKIN